MNRLNSRVKDSLVSLYDLDDFKRKNIWFHVIMSVWNRDNVDSCFNECESIFFRELLNNNGFLKKTTCLRFKVLFTEWKVSKTAQNLSDMGLVDKYTLGNKEVVYVLNLSLYREVFKDEVKG